MKREILYKGMDVNTKQWRQGSLVMVTDGETLKRYPYIVLSYNHDTFDWIEVVPEIVCQFTGLKDKEGKSIFEGDIIELENFQGNKIRVVCKFGTVRRLVYENEVDITGFYFQYGDHTKTFPIVNNYAGKHDLELFEVIGNIYDNPELLK